VSFPRYPKYKDSGVEWLGEVPEHWVTQPLCSIADECSESNVGLAGANLLSLSYGEIVRKDATANDGLLPESFETYQIVRLGDIVLRLTDLQNDQRSLRSALVSETGIITSAYLAIRPRNIGSEYIAYLLRAYDRTKVFYSMGGGLRQSMKFADLKRLPMLLPPKWEQDQIVAFLKSETAKLDALIAEQRRLVALLHDKRQATISDAVAGGMNPDSPTVPLHGKGLTRIPAHWEVRTLSSVTEKITNGYVGPTRDILVDDGIRYLQSLHIKQNQIRFDVPYYVTAEWSARHSKSILETGDVLVVQTGDIGQSAVVTPDFTGCNCHALIVITPRVESLLGEWLAWYFTSAFGMYALLSVQTGALHPHLNCGKVKALVVPVPPLKEQREISTAIYRQVREVDTLAQEAECAVVLLEERRTALISAAVTGKIDVRNYATDAAEAA